MASTSSALPFRSLAPTASAQAFGSAPVGGLPPLWPVYPELPEKLSIPAELLGACGSGLKPAHDRHGPGRPDGPEPAGGESPSSAVQLMHAQAMALYAQLLLAEVPPDCLQHSAAGPRALAGDAAKPRLNPTPMSSSMSAIGGAGQPGGSGVGSSAGVAPLKLVAPQATSYFQLKDRVWAASLYPPPLPAEAAAVAAALARHQAAYQGAAGSSLQAAIGFASLDAESDEEDLSPDEVLEAALATAQRLASAALLRAEATGGLVTELASQTGRQCAERGALLQRVWADQAGDVAAALGEAPLAALVAAASGAQGELRDVQQAHADAHENADLYASVTAENRRLEAATEKMRFEAAEVAHARKLAGVLRDEMRVLKLEAGRLRTERDFCRGQAAVADELRADVVRGAKAIEEAIEASMQVDLDAAAAEEAAAAAALAAANADAGRMAGRLRAAQASIIELREQVAANQAECGDRTVRPAWAALEAAPAAFTIRPDGTAELASSRQAAQLLDEKVEALELQIAELASRMSMPAPAAATPKVLKPAFARPQWRLKCRWDAAHIYCKGTGSANPRFLRRIGRVKNRDLTLDAARAIVRDVFATRLLDREAGGTRLAEFMYGYLRRRFGSAHNVITEMGYNLIVKLDCLLPDGKPDPELDLFRRVLDDEKDAEVYYDLQAQLLRFGDYLSKVDRMGVSGRAPAGELLVDDFVTALRLVFPYKSDAQVSELRGALGREAARAGGGFRQDRDRVRYGRLLAAGPGTGGATNDVLVALLRQAGDEKRAFAKDLARRFAELDFAKSGELPASRFYQGIAETDTRKPPEEVAAYVGRGYDAMPEALPATSRRRSFTGAAASGAVAAVAAVAAATAAAATTAPTVLVGGGGGGGGGGAVRRPDAPPAAQLRRQGSKSEAAAATAAAAVAGPSGAGSSPGSSSAGVPGPLLPVPADMPMDRACFLERLSRGVLRRTDPKADGGVIAGVKTLTTAAALTAYAEAAAEVVSAGSRKGHISRGWDAT